MRQHRKRVQRERWLYAAKMAGWFLFCCLVFAAIILIINVFWGVCQ